MPSIRCFVTFSESRVPLSCSSWIYNTICLYCIRASLLDALFIRSSSKKVPQFGNASVVLVKFDCIHSCSSSMCSLSLSLMIAHLLSAVNLFPHLHTRWQTKKGPAAFAGPFRLWEIMKYQSIFTMLPQPAAQRFLLRFFLRGAERAGFWVGTESLECFCSIRYLT